MIATLVAVTLISLIFALAMVVIVWRLLREEGRRSAARVAMLEAASRNQDEAPSSVWSVEAVHPSRFRAEPEIGVPTPAMALAGSIGGSEQQERDPDEGIASLDQDLFASTARPTRAARRFGMVAAVGLIVVGTVAAIVVSWNLRALQSQTAQAVAPAEMVSSRSPLELVSLAHRRDGEGITVTGLIRNPANGAPVKSLTVVVLFFGRDGAFLTSARAPIDYSSLLPGDESPFVVRVRQPGSVGRYRVSFRTDERVVPHVDRREDARFARSDG